MLQDVQPAQLLWLQVGMLRWRDLGEGDTEAPALPVTVFLQQMAAVGWGGGTRQAWDSELWAP